MSLDGVITDPQDWTGPYFDEDAGTYSTERLFASDTLLLGRVTYETFAAAWPSMADEGEYGENMNSIKTYVVSSTLTKAEWNNATIIKGDKLVQEVTKLKKSKGGDILIFGVGKLAHALIAAGLLDELEIWLHPVLVGNTAEDAGIIQKGSSAGLKLAGTKQTSTGVLILSYTPADAES